MTDTPQVAVMLSGEGTNFAAIADYASRCKTFEVGLVISDRADAAGLQKARDRGIPAEAIVRAADEDRTGHETRIAERLARLSLQVIALAGYMRILGPTLVHPWRGRMLNVHPSLLPKYRGLHTYRRALADGAREHGASVHYVTEELDGGPVIAQARTRIADDDTEHTLRNRVQSMEYTLFPRVIEAICLGHVCFNPPRTGRDSGVLWRGEALNQPLDLASLQALTV